MAGRRDRWRRGGNTPYHCEGDSDDSAWPINVHKRKYSGIGSCERDEIMNSKLNCTCKDLIYMDPHSLYLSVPFHAIIRFASSSKVVIWERETMMAERRVLRLATMLFASVVSALEHID